MAHGMLYRIRWSIETSYRVMKEHFKASTTSISDAIRIFVWKLALLFYNAWLLLRILLRDKGMVVKPGETALRTHSFQRFLETDYG
jgi:IS4 transposase